MSEQRAEKNELLIPVSSMQTKSSPQYQNQYGPLNDHNHAHRKVPSRHQRHNSSSAAMESPRRYQYPYASTEQQQHTYPPAPQSKHVYQYDAPWPLYALDWCKTPGEQRGHRLAIGSIIEESNNKLQIIARTDTLEGSMYPPNQHSPDFTVAAEADVYYPTTKVMWEPFRGSSRRTDLLATTGDILRIWELVDHPRYGTTSNSINSSNGRNSPAYYMQQLVKKAELANTKQSDFCAPLTSFDWNETDPSLIVTASIDTTCTVWNVETNQAKTQLIAHDSDVYDVAFMHNSADIFASVGADGSVRLFDLRSLEHSTILYEAPSNATPINSNGAVMNPGTCPLLRLQFCRTNSNLLATFHMDSASALILDIRYPSTPMAELTKGHQGSINGVSWSPTKAGHICTGGDDGQVLVWDVNHGAEQQQSHYQQQRYSLHTPRSIQEPLLAYSAVSEVNSVCWSKGVPDWIGIGFGKTVQALKV